MNIILAALTAVSMFFLVRACLIVIGFLKEPIIESFSEYGPREQMYMSGQQLLLWTGVLFICGALWASAYQNLSSVLGTVGILACILVVLGYTYRERAEKIHLKILKYPLWYHDLRERTTRYERRRIGYMWLHLPLRTRLSYNSSDKLFLVWADFVIMGTIREEELNPHDEEYFYTGH